MALDTDINLGNPHPILLHAGVEYKPLANLAIRAGMDQDAISPNKNIGNLTGGIGLSLAGVSVDYAYHQDSNLSDNFTHYISLSLKPEGKINSDRTAADKDRQKLDILSYYK